MQGNCIFFLAILKTNLFCHPTCSKCNFILNFEFCFSIYFWNGSTEFKFQGEPNLQTGQKSALQHLRFWRYANVSKLEPTIHSSVISTFQWGDFREQKLQKIIRGACPPRRSFRKSVSQPRSAPATNDLFMNTSLWYCFCLMSTLVIRLNNSVTWGS